VTDEYGREFCSLFVGEFPAFPEEFQGHAGDVAFVLFCKDPHSFVRRKVGGRPRSFVNFLNGFEFADFNAGPAHGAGLGNECLAVPHFDCAEGACGHAGFAGRALIGYDSNAHGNSLSQSRCQRADCRRILILRFCPASDIWLWSSVLNKRLFFQL
jgi:hypothetical protein